MKFGRFLEGFILGGLIGAGIMMILAPISGDQFRLQLQMKAENLRAEVEKAAKDRRAELEQQLAALRAQRPPTSQ